MSKPNYTHVTLVLDASGSMNRYRHSVQRSVLAFIRAQTELPGSLTISLVIFNSSVTARQAHFLTPDEAIRYIENNYGADGGTALYDAVGSSAHEVASRIVSLADSEQPEKILFAIVTDGEESGCSRRFSTNDVKTIVDYHEETYDWEFLYVGANQNAYATGKAFGIKAGKALSYAATQDGLEQAMEAVSGAVTRYRQNGAPHANQFFSGDDHAFQAALGASASPTSG